MISGKKLLVAACLLTLLIPATGCEREGDMERAGKAVDQMVRDAGESFDDTVGDVRRTLGLHEPGPMEELLGENGRPLDEFIQSAEKFFSKAAADAKALIRGTRK